MFKPLTLAAALFLTAIIFNGCSKETETLPTATIADYYPTEIGKSVTYRMDSTVFVNFNSTEEVHSYVAMDVVEAQLTDNLNRPSFRVHRYIRDTAETQPWMEDVTYLVTPLQTSLELVDNNLRYIKLHLPIRDDYSWKGNSYIDTYSTNSDLHYLDDWDYIYANAYQPYDLGNQVVDSSVIVNQIDEVIGDPTVDSVFSRKDYSIEVYGKGIGLIYKNFLHREYQPPTPGKDAYILGYGIKLIMIRHD
jgi:hypothetical protein